MRIETPRERYLANHLTAQQKAKIKKAAAAWSAALAKRPGYRPYQPSGIRINAEDKWSEE